MTSHMRVLTVLSDPELWARLQGILSRRQVEVNRVPSGAGALILTGNLRYDLIIIQHPLPDLSLDDLLVSIRTLDSTSTNSPVVVLVDPALKPAEAPTREGDLVKILPSDVAEGDFNSVMSNLLGVAARFAARVMVQIEVGLDSGISSRLYQAENLSETGVLLRGGQHIPIDTPVRFEFNLPNEVDPIAGIGLVVRHTSMTETTPGIALQFADLGADHLRRLRRYTAEVTAAPAVTASESPRKPGAESTVQP